jgi:hypothetical protein
MTRTVPSASANLTVATSVARWEGELDENVLRPPSDNTLDPLESGAAPAENA